VRARGQPADSVVGGVAALALNELRSVGSNSSKMRIRGEQLRLRWPQGTPPWTLVLEHVALGSNRVALDGGLLYLERGVRVRATDVVFERGLAGRAGAAVFVDGASGERRALGGLAFVCSRCAFRNNSAGASAFSVYGFDGCCSCRGTLGASVAGDGSNTLAKARAKAATAKAAMERAAAADKAAQDAELATERQAAELERQAKAERAKADAAAEVSSRATKEATTGFVASKSGNSTRCP